MELLAALIIKAMIILISYEKIVYMLRYGDPSFEFMPEDVIL
jgi:hypothetical protein